MWREFVFELGSASDMLNFFSYLNKLSRTERDRYLLERIYCKYIKFDEIDESCALLNELKIFALRTLFINFQNILKVLNGVLNQLKSFMRTGIYIKK